MSPARMGLLTAGLSMMAQPRWSNQPRGPFEDFGRAGLMGLGAYSERLADVNRQRQGFLQNQRQAQRALQDKQLWNMKMKTAIDAREQKRKMTAELPNLLKAMSQLPITGIEQQISAIQAMASAGNVEGAYQSATNIISQKATSRPDIHHKMIDGTDSGYIYDKNTGQYLGQFNAGSTSNNQTTVIGKQAFLKLKEIYPNFKSEGDVNNLAVELNPDGSVRKYSYVRPDRSLDFREQTMLQATIANYRNEPLMKMADTGVAQYMTLQKLGRTPPTKTPKGEDFVSGVSDVAIIFGFMKSLDPTSVVRESEYATASNAGLGIPDKIWRAYNHARDGQILLPSVREEIIRVAKDAVLGKAKQFDLLRENYIKSADPLGLRKEDLELVLRDPYKILKMDTSDSDHPPPPEIKTKQTTESGTLSNEQASDKAIEILGSSPQVSVPEREEPEPEPEKVPEPEPELPASEEGVSRNEKGKVVRVIANAGEGASHILAKAGLPATPKTFLDCF